MKLISHYRVVDQKIYLYTPYCDDVVFTCRSWGGRWDGDLGAWVVSATRLPDIQAMLGKGLDDLVQVEVGSEDWTGYGQLRVGWYILASRRDRDRNVDFYAELIAGKVPAHGGSRKSPAVDPSDGARFRLWVPRDFAKDRNLQVVQDLRESAPPVVEGELLPQIVICVSGGVVQAVKSTIPLTVLILDYDCKVSVDANVRANVASEQEKEEADRYTMYERVWNDNSLSFQVF